MDPRGRRGRRRNTGSSSAKIRCRLLSGSVKGNDRSFFLERIAAARRYRGSWCAGPQDAYRLVHAECDLSLP